MPGAIDPKFLALAWTLLTFLFSAGIAYGTIRLTLRYHGKEIQDIRADVSKNKVDIYTRIESHEHFVKGALFRPTGATNYILREECDQCRVACQSRVEGRIEDMMHAIEAGEKKREASVSRWASAFERIFQQIGRLEGKVLNGNNGKSGVGDNAGQ